MPVKKTDKELRQSGSVSYVNSQIKIGGQFPPVESIERIAKYRRMRDLYFSEKGEVHERAISLLKDTPHAEKLRALYIACNIADPIITKPADLLVGEPPLFDSGNADDSEEQVAINSYVEENDLVKLIHESVLANGYRGDSWLRIKYGYRQDYSALLELGFEVPETAEMEPIIEHVNADLVFPELKKGSLKDFKAVNVAAVEWEVDADGNQTPFLNVERHIPGYIIYERYKLSQPTVSHANNYGYPIDIFTVEKQVATGRENDVVETKVPHILLLHVPYKSTDDRWYGKGTLEALESILVAINDRLVSIDYILQKHSDPIMYGPEITNTKTVHVGGGAYIPVGPEEVPPGYLTWDGKLDGAFRELETLIGMAFQIAETPQWLFGTVLGDQNAGGTGTSHTDGAAIKARFMPILSKVSRIKTHYDRAIRDALYLCQLLDIEHGNKRFEAVYPTITWRDGLPVNEKELAEIAAIRTGNKPTIDVLTAIKRLDNLDDMQAAEIIGRIDVETEKELGTVTSSIFNEEPTQGTEEADA